MERTVPFVTVGVLLLAIPLALKFVFVAAVVAAMVTLLLVLSLFGLDRSSTAALVAAFFTASWDKFNLPGLAILTPSDALFFLGIALALPRLMTRRLWLPPAFVIGSLVFFTFAVLSCLSSESPGESSYYAARVVLTWIVIPALLVWWSPRGKVLLTLALAYAAGTCVSVVAGIPSINGWRNLGLSQHPNILGYTAVLAMALLPFLLRALAPQHRVWVGLGVLATVGAGIMTSGSRAALVVAIVLVLLYPAAERSVLAALTVLASGVVAILIVGQRGAAGGGEDALSRLLGSGTAHVANEARAEGVAKVWDIAVQHPFLGTGFTFSDFLGHNSYVQIAAAAGFISLAAFAVILWSMVAPLFVHDDIHSRLVYPAIAVIVISPVSPNLTDRYIALMLGLSLTGVVAVYEARRRRVVGDAAATLARPSAAAGATTWS